MTKYEEYYVNHGYKLKGVKNCLYCGTEMRIYLKRDFERHKFCSRRCLNKYHYEKGNIKIPIYKENNKTPLRQIIRSSERYNSWKKDILERDGYECKKCGYKKKLYVHHIISFKCLVDKLVSENKHLDLVKDRNELSKLAMEFIPLWDKNNGITLCYKCHQKEHSKNGKCFF